LCRLVRQRISQPRKQASNPLLLLRLLALPVSVSQSAAKQSPKARALLLSSPFFVYQNPKVVGKRSTRVIYWKHKKDDAQKEHRQTDERQQQPHSLTLCIDDCKYAVLRQSFCLSRRPLRAAPGGRVEPDKTKKTMLLPDLRSARTASVDLRRDRSASVVSKKGHKCFGRPYEGGEVRSSSLRSGRSAFFVHLQSLVRSLNSERIWPSSPLLSPYYYRRRLLDEPPGSLIDGIPFFSRYPKGP
jgi:hypothetical protein